MNRRSFLTLGGAGVVTSAVVGAGGAHSAEAAKPAQLARAGLVGPTLEAGYVLGSATGDGCACKGATPQAAPFIAMSALPAEAPFQPNMISARNIGPGDATLSGSGAKVRVCGVFPTDETRLKSFISALTVGFNSFHAPGAVFRAWGYSARSVSQSVTFGWPVDPIAGLSLCFEFSDVFGNKGSMIRELIPSMGGPSSKLQCGLYVFALRQAGGSGPVAWSKYELRAADLANEGAKRYLYQRNALRGGLTLVDFPYVVIRIDRA